MRVGSIKDRPLGSAPDIKSDAVVFTQAIIVGIGYRAKAGNVYPNGGLLLVPWTKTGGVDVPAVNLGVISPGGLPRNSSWMLAGVSQLENSPNPPRKTQSPFPLISHAAPIRGL